jgi:hypothetical protein
MARHRPGTSSTAPWTSGHGRSAPTCRPWLAAATASLACPPGLDYITAFLAVFMPAWWPPALPPAGADSVAFFAASVDAQPRVALCAAPALATLGRVLTRPA